VQRLGFFMLLALALRSSHAAASQSTSPLIHLDWDGCTSSAASNRDFACDTNDGHELLVASYTAEAVANEPPSQFTFRVTFSSGQPEPPSWWQTYPAGCRAGAMTLDESFLTGGTCLHFPSHFFYSAQVVSAGGIRLTGGILLTQPTIPEPLIAGQTYFLFNMNIAHTKSLGADSCAGCAQPLSIFFEEFKIYTTTTGLEYTYDGFATPKATWQWSQVPTRNATWGQIKSLYR